MSESSLEKLRRIAEIAERKPETKMIKAKTPEGKEISFDMEKVRERWYNFYKDNGLEQMAEALPEKINLNPEQVKRIQELAEKEGFNDFLILPPNPDQYLEQVKTQTEKEMAGLASDEQYRIKPDSSGQKGIWLSDTVKPNFLDKIKTLNRPENKAYLVFFKNTQEVDPETKNKSADELRKEFKEKGLTGLTAIEYLVFQRNYTQENKKHPETTTWTWLLDSEIHGRILDAEWTPDDRQVLLSSISPDYQDSNLGARFSAIFKIADL